MVPSIAGTTYHFESRGLYDGVSLLRDDETGSLWHHVTGEALSGPLAGSTMPIFNLLQMTVEATLRAYPGMRVAISDRPIRGGGTEHRVDREMELNEQFRRTMSAEDTRRPTMEIGLGIWSDDAVRYYAVSDVRDRGGVVLDRLGDRGVAIYLEPLTGVPMALYSSAENATWGGDELRFSDGTLVAEGVLRDETGGRLPIRRPLQLFTRWYGWALMRPDTEIWTP